MISPYVKRDDLLLPAKRQGPIVSIPIPSTSASASTASSTATSTTTSTTATTSSSSTSSSTTSTTSVTSVSSSTSVTSATSTTTASTSTSAPASTTPSTTLTLATLTTAQSLTTGSNGVVVTLTYTDSDLTPTTSSSASNKSSFFNNKAEVGAVFGVGSVIALVLAFLLVTTCIRRRKAAQFDRDVAEAAAAAAAANANPFYEDEEDRAGVGASWDPRRTSATYGQGYGRIGDDPYAYAAAGVVGAGTVAGFGRSNTNQFQQRTPQDAYSMNDLSNSSVSHPSSYPNYGGGGAAYYSNDLPQPEYGRPSFSSTAAPGLAGVGSGGAALAQTDNQLRHRGQQQSSGGNPEDAYGGYAITTPESDPYTNQYSNNQASTPYTSGMSNRLSAISNPASVPPSRSPPSGSPPLPPPSYSQHSGQDHVPTDRKTSRPPSGLPMPAPAPNTPLPPTPNTPDETWAGDQSRVLRVANE